MRFRLSILIFLSFLLFQILPGPSQHSCPEELSIFTEQASAGEPKVLFRLSKHLRPFTAKEQPEAKYDRRSTAWIRILHVHVPEACRKHLQGGHVSRQTVRLLWRAEILGLTVLCSVLRLHHLAPLRSLFKVKARGTRDHSPQVFLVLQTKHDEGNPSRSQPHGE